MRSLLVVLNLLLFTGRSFAQENAIGYPQLSGYLQAERNSHGLLFGKRNGELDVTRFLKLYAQQQAAKNPGRIHTFMDRPVPYSAVLPVEINRDMGTLYQRYSAASREPSAASQLFGLAAGIAAGAISKGRYTGVYNPYPYSGGSRYPDGSFRYLDSRAAIEAAFLQSTYRQYGK